MALNGMPAEAKVFSSLLGLKGLNCEQPLRRQDAEADFL